MAEPSPPLPGRVAVGEAPFDIAAETALLTRGRADIGGLASFIGLCRADSGLAAMTLEHYPGMTEKALAGIEAEARGRWPLLTVEIIHRVGSLEPGEPIVFVGTSSAHRQAAFDACAFIMDYLKTRAPFWKKERTPEGERWVEGRCSDQQAAQRWDKP